MTAKTTALAADGGNYAVFVSIVREQNYRTTDGAAVRGSDAHQAMTDARLDAELAAAERRFIEAMNTSYTDPARHGEYADAMRAALSTLDTALTRHDTVTRARDKHLGACDLERAGAYVSMLTVHPEAAGLLSALDRAENAARALFTAAGIDITDYLRAVNAFEEEVTAAEVVYDAARLHVGAYTAFLVALPEYTRLRSYVGADGADLAAAADRMTMLGVRIDRARSDMAAAYARDRRHKTYRASV
jgi:hypothetical protein